MEGDNKPPEKEPGRTGWDEPPPFKPDSRLVTYLERGRKDDAPERFRKALQDLEKRSR